MILRGFFRGRLVVGLSCCEMIVGEHELWGRYVITYCKYGVRSMV
jgi:hypothetical protein